MQRYISLLMAVLILFGSMPALTESFDRPAMELEDALGRIPRIEVYANSLTNWVDKKDEREATMTYTDPVTGDSFTEIITLRPQGTSSLSYVKKNFTIVFQTGEVEVNPDWGYQSEYCLKANYIDPTQACNVVSARLAGQIYRDYGLHEDAPNNGAVDGFPVWLVFNGIPEGLYTMNIPKAAWTFGMDENNEDHIVMCCEGITDGCMFRQDYYDLDEEEWSLEVGGNTTKTIARFQRLVEFIANASDEEFVENFDQYLNLDACLIYYCFICIANAQDNIGKNMLMATWDGEVWHPILYDLDSLWGINWDGSAAWKDSAVAYVVNADNRLYQRLRENFAEELNGCYANLRNGVLSVENIWKEFEAFAESIPDEMLAWDNAYYHASGTRIRSYELMDTLIQQYLPEVDAEFGYVTEESYSRP